MAGLAVVAGAALAACSGGGASVSATAPTGGVTAAAAAGPAAAAPGSDPSADPSAARSAAPSAAPAVTPAAARSSRATASSGATSRDAATGRARPERSVPAPAGSTTRRPAATTSPPTAPAGLGACPDARTAKAGSASGKAPVQFTNGWTSAPVEGCSYTDKQGRTYTVSAAQNRMLYRVNQMRTLQNAKDGKKRPVLKPDFCLQELAQDYTESGPGGHNPLLMKMYAVPGGGGAATGSVWIGENYGMHGGYTSKRMAQVDRLVYNWFTSGSLTSGHYGNMMDRTWRRAGFGIVADGSSVLSIQNFSADPAYYAYPGGKKCSKPPKKKYASSTVPPIGPYPGG